MNVHATISLDRAVVEALTAPAFLPLADVPPGAHVLESQSTLAVQGVVGLEGQVTLAPLGTLAGAVPSTILAQGLVFPVATMPSDPLLTRTPDLLGHPGVLGVVLTQGAVPAGMQVRGTLSLVYGSI